MPLTRSGIWMARSWGISPRKSNADAPGSVPIANGPTNASAGRRTARARYAYAVQSMVHGQGLRSPGAPHAGENAVAARSPSASGMASHRRRRSLTGRTRPKTASRRINPARVIPV
jgi:hypothetical protein